MKDRTALTIACLHISAALYCLLGISLFLLSRTADRSESLGPGLVAFLLVLTLALAFGVELLVTGLKKRRSWAWIVGLIVCGLYIPSLFLPLGALGLWGLLAAGSRKTFGVGLATTSSGPPPTSDRATP
jgi:thiol:disulfide interchange protein